MKKIIFLFLLVFFIFSEYLNAQNIGNSQFWETMQKHCGRAYSGTIIEGGKEGDGFSGKELVMYVLSCEDNQIKIPFFVGEDKSRTWILTFENDRITLKHDHRYETGLPDSVTMYGGTTNNVGWKTKQVFPADQTTCEMIDYACNNVWWMTLDDKSFTYNLRRIGTDRLFSVKFDLTQPLEFNQKPWGWKD